MSETVWGLIPTVLLDMDGTIAQTEMYTAMAVRDILAEQYGVTLTREEDEYAIGRSWIDIYALLARKVPDIMPVRELQEECVRRREALFEREPLPVMPGVLQFVQRASAHVPCCIVTGSCRAEVEQVCRFMGLHRYIPNDRIITSDDVTAGKPDPQGYLKAMAKVGAAPAKQCVVFEDSRAGIAAGKAAGCLVVALRAFNYTNQDQSEADAVVETFDDVSDVFLHSLLLGQRGPHLVTAQRAA